MSTFKLCKECGKEITDDKSPTQTKEYHKTCRSRMLYRRHREKMIQAQQKVRVRQRKEKGLKLIQCPYCGLEFNNLQSHINRSHK